MTLVMTLIVAFVLIALVLTGPLVEAIGDELGLGDAGLAIFSIAKWPLLFASSSWSSASSIASRPTPATPACAGSFPEHAGDDAVAPGLGGIQLLRRQLRRLLEIYGSLAGGSSS